jgi:hypothetical protein
MKISFASRIWKLKWRSYDGFTTVPQLIHLHRQLYTVPVCLQVDVYLGFLAYTVNEKRVINHKRHKLIHITFINLLAPEFYI